jgi:hypothetical protein
MLSRGLKVTFIVGVLLGVCVILLHFVFRVYKTPTDEELEILGTFFATFASTILPFSSGLCSSATRSREPTPKGFASLSCSWLPSSPKL